MMNKRAIVFEAAVALSLIVSSGWLTAVGIPSAGLLTTGILLAGFSLLTRIDPLRELFRGAMINLLRPVGEDRG